MHKKLLAAFVSLSVFATAGVALAAKDNTSALKGVVARFHKAMMANNFDDMRQMLSSHMMGAWDSDMNGRPAAWNTGDEVIKFFVDNQEAMKHAGGQCEYTQKSINCRTSGEMGVCLHEGEYRMTMPNMPTMTMNSRGTEIMMREKGAWKIVHHHGSLAKAPEMPAQFMAMAAKDANFQDVPGMPGMKFSPIWMNPATQASAMIFKVGSDAIKQPRHFHPFAATFVVIDGSITTTDANGKETEYGPGSVVYRAAKELHTTTMKSGTIMFGVTEGPMITIPVDEKGNPMLPKS